MKRSVVVFDTDARRAQEVCAMLEHASFTPSLDIQSVCEPKILREVAARGNVDVLLCDMRMSIDESNGAEVALEAVKQAAFVQVVLLGVNDSNLVRAESLNPAYLLPAGASQSVFEAAIEKVLALREKCLDQPFIVHTRRFERVIQPSKMSYVESDRRKLRLHVGDEVVETYGKISELRDSLSSRFVQCHKSFLVNMGFVEQWGREYVLLTTGERVPVSQKRRKVTHDAIVAYVGRVM